MVPVFMKNLRHCHPMYCPYRLLPVPSTERVTMCSKLNGLHVSSHVVTYGLVSVRCCRAPCRLVTAGDDLEERASKKSRNSAWTTLLHLNDSPTVAGPLSLVCSAVCSFIVRATKIATLWICLDSLILTDSKTPTNFSALNSQRCE